MEIQNRSGDLAFAVQLRDVRVVVDHDAVVEVVEEPGPATQMH